MYSTLALEKEREEETAFRKEKEAVCCYVHVYVYMIHVYKLYKDAYNHTYSTCTMYNIIQTSTGSRDGLENHIHTQTDTNYESI